METVKINNNQNIVEKHFKYTDLFNILFFPLLTNKIISPKANQGISLTLANMCFLSFVPYLIIDNLPADFEDFRYIYIDAPMIDAIGNTPYSLSISNSPKVKSLFSGTGTSAGIIYNEPKETLTGDSFTETYCCTNNVLKDTFDFSIDKTSLLPYEIRNSRQLYIQIPSYLLGNAISVFKNTIEPKYTYQHGFEKVERSVFDNITVSKTSNEQPFFTTESIPVLEDSPTIVKEALSTAENKYRLASGLNTRLSTDIYSATVTPDNWKASLTDDIFNERLKEMSGQTWSDFLNYINSPLENTSYNGIDKTNFVTRLITKNNGWENKNPISFKDTSTSTVQRLYTINQNKSFYEDKLFSIFFSKDPMGI